MSHNTSKPVIFQQTVSKKKGSSVIWIATLLISVLIKSVQSNIILSSKRQQENTVLHTTADNGPSCDYRLNFTRGMDMQNSGIYC